VIELGDQWLAEFSVMQLLENLLYFVIWATNLMWSGYGGGS